MFCCLNPACLNPSVPKNTKFCFNCGTALVILRNRYCPIKSFGAGIFGKTYLAQNVEKSNEKCIIKQLPLQVEEKTKLHATELFEQEAIRLQQLGEHPQIPTLLDYFKVDNCLYLVQQFIDGPNLLERLIQQKTFNEEKLRNFLEDLLNILKFVHQNKVIHQEIKAENLIQREDDKVVLIGFGISKELAKSMLGEQGSMIGSFGYAAPEQMKEGETYPSSDLFSLGATCFHLLTGIDPLELWIDRDYAWVNSWEEHLQKSISQGLRKIIGQLLQVDYRQRYQSVEEVLQDLNQPSQSVEIKNAEYYYKQGIEKSDLKDYQGAIKNFNKAIRINPNYAEAYLKRGNSHYLLTNKQSAIEDYKQAIKINPNYAEAYNNWGDVCYEQGDYQIAIEDYNRAIEINPNYANAYFKRGIVRIYLGDYQGAVEDYSQALQINPNYIESYFLRGYARIYLGDYQGAIEDYSQAVQINPKYADAYNSRGFLYYELGNYQVAIEDYNRAIEINPNYADIYYNRGNAYSHLEEKEAAIEDFRKAADLYEQQGKEGDYQNALNRIKELES